MPIALARTIRRKLSTKRIAPDFFEPVHIAVNLGKERLDLHGAVADSFACATHCGVVFSDVSPTNENKPKFSMSKPDVVLSPGDYLVVRLPEGSIQHVLHDNRENNLAAAKAWLAVAKDYLKTAKEFSERVQQTSVGAAVPLKKAYDASLFALRAVSLLRASPPFSEDLYSAIGTLKSLGSRIPPEWSKVEKSLRKTVEQIYNDEQAASPAPGVLNTSLIFARDVITWANRELSSKGEELVSSPSERGNNRRSLSEKPKRKQKKNGRPKSHR